MNERVFQEPLTLEQIEKVINEYMKDNMLDLKEKEILEKWNYASLLCLEKPKTKEKFLEAVVYIDELSLPLDKKINNILTLCYLIIKEKFKIAKMDINNIYLLTSYLKNLKIKNIKASLKYLNNQTLLEKVRLKSLDLEVREKIIAYVDKQQLNIDEFVSWVDKINYHELVKTIS